jgi:hypothetical protein
MENKMDYKESGYNQIQGDKNGTFSTSERKWISKIRKLKEKYPNEVIIRKENSDGSILVDFPACWFKITPKRVISDTRRETMSENFRKRVLDKNK